LFFEPKELRENILNILKHNKIIFSSFVGVLQNSAFGV
jgi:hypothetical protein